MKSSVYVPTEEDMIECQSGKGCSYGLCDECIVCTDGKESEDKDEEHK